jgi:hypothetical protein
MNQSRKMSQWWGGLFSLIALVMAFAATSANANFCLRDTYGRGVGTVPAACADADRAMDAGLCYKKCGPGHKAFATLCARDCPAGFADDGLYCRKPAAPAPYGVGAGYGWKVGDVAFNYDKAGDRCRAANSEGCVRDGLIWYPNCKAGFHKTGALICSPNEIKCPAGTAEDTVGLSLGLSCIKLGYDRGVGTIPNSCGSGKQLDAGLCYDNCKPNFAGVGPVCGQQCSGATPVSCGVVGCARSQKDCIESALSPFTSVLEVIGTPGWNAAMVSKDSAITIKNQVIATAARFRAELSGVPIEELISLQAARAGVVIAGEQLLALANALRGQDFDPYKIDSKTVQVVVKAYSKPQLCKN